MNNEARTPPGGEKRDLIKRPRITRAIDALLNPLMGKSIVLYFTKPAVQQDASPESHT